MIRTEVHDFERLKKLLFVSDVSGVKGQLILKAIYSVLDSPKKRMKNI